jgi:hypothetical protein
MTLQLSWFGKIPLQKSKLVPDHILTLIHQTIPLYKLFYSLRPIILFANIDLSRYILVVDTSVSVKSNMGRRE